MATTGSVIGDYQTKTVKIDTDLSGKTGYAVSLDTTDDGVVNLLAAATSVPFVLLEGADGSTTETVGTIVISGQTEVKVGGAVAPGDKLTATTGGEWIATTTDTNNYGAIALETGADGDMIAVSVERGMIAG